MSKALVPESKQGLSAFKNEVAAEMGVPFTDYNGDVVPLVVKWLREW